ncbi:MAG: helix-turn-helix domain-containing protein [Flavobacteriales bacterium]
MAMKKHSGNISKAARDLGITRSALYRRLEKHNL